MKKILLFILITFLLAVPRAYAGIGLFEGSVSLTALETKTVCNLMIYSTIEGRNYFHIEYGDEIKRFVSDIEPNDFYLETINCPGESEARRECIKNLCEEGQDSYCRIICTTFTGPFELSLDPKPVRYNGNIRDEITAGASKIVDALPFTVFYTPYDLKIIIGFVVVIIIIIAVIVLLNKRHLTTVKRKR
jgi:hypothetical protein